MLAHTLSAAAHAARTRTVRYRVSRLGCLCWRSLRPWRMDLKIRNLVRNHHLAKSISDAAWYQFTEWLEYLARISGVPIVAIPPHFTSQDCPKCGYRSKKTLSTRTHRCSQCGHEEHRDTAAAKVILARGLEFLGETAVRPRTGSP